MPHTPPARGLPPQPNGRKNMDDYARQSQEMIRSQQEIRNRLSRKRAHQLNQDAPAWGHLKHDTISQDRSGDSNHSQELLVALEKPQSPPFEETSDENEVDEDIQNLPNPIFNITEASPPPAPRQGLELGAKPFQERGLSKRSYSNTQLDIESVSKSFGDPASSTNVEGDLFQKLKHLLETETQRRENDETTSVSTLSWITLYRLGDSISLNEPSWALTDDGSKTLRAEKPLANVSRYLDRHPEVVFVVYQDYPILDSRDSSTKEEDEEEGEEILHAPKPSHECITLSSRYMIEAVRAFTKAQPDSKSRFPHFDPADEIAAPYLFWYYGRHSYPKIREALLPGQQRLLDFLSLWIEDYYKQEYMEVESHLADGLISHKLMEYLICPGDVLVSNQKNSLEAYIGTTWPQTDLRRNLPQQPLNGKARQKPDSLELRHRKRKVVLSVEGWCWEYDGTFRSSEKALEFTYWTSSPDEKLKITDLEIFPLKYATETIRAALQRRGETYWKCRGQKLVDYQSEPKDEMERYMIDYKTYEMLHKDSIYGGRTSTEENRAIHEVIGPEGDEIYIFPQTVKAYNLRRKKWVDLKVDKIKEVVWNKKAFDKLVVDKDTKELIQALVTTHLQDEQGADLVSGKGNGLILLLHGGPGTGKTFTAETVAELAEKPLYRVTCGDIGTKPEDVEKYLESVLHLGHIWGCVVLLDEADVFLEERVHSNLDRNALVSVFLRVLEYYDGILILTSNRVGTFDEAFKSRIQLALKYDNLGVSQRRQIWSNFFEHYEEMGNGSMNFISIKAQVDELAKYKMNGRQIRNAITTARQLARYRGEVMNYSHLQHVIRVSQNFETYLDNLREGVNSDDVFHGAGIR
ncbi:uncharacterized protein F4822DRAFT_400596 [Hypoxylon trugodes]|uniref:uncharacterized protein n=1 Tax=Hypoxylon trugodes TaxID=326681 RepID=UPI00219961FA|nr:uncharacterized protein F4822DRAFT_400596 [Hypoxylon trugodes]KAI1390037.1 hypothetical protein F4822DRAFT_400596 [Hypoxylon trugodes]